MIIVKWHDKYAFTRRWKVRANRLLCRLFGHRIVEIWEEEKFDMRRLGQMEKVETCSRCRCLPRAQ